MTFDLSSIRKTRRDIPERTTVHGLHKVGKTTFAANCPGVIFIPTEDGQDSVDAESFPLCKSWDDVMSAITTLYMEKHDFKAVCLDSIDWAMQLAYTKVCADHEVSNIEEVLKGYGKGYGIAADLFREMLDGFNALRTDRGMRIIVLAHTEIKKFDDPEAESYDRYQIKLQKSSCKILQEWSDVIGFAKAETTTVEGKKEGFGKEKRTRGMDLGRRVLCLERSVAFDAGNRYGLPKEIPLLWPDYEQALTTAKNGATKTTKEKK